MNAATEGLKQSTVAQYCKLLRLPTVAGQCRQLAEQAERAHHTYLAYLEALLMAEVEEQERRVVGRRLLEAHLPRVKTLEEFDFSQTPSVSAANIAALAEGGYIQQAEPVVFIGLSWWDSKGTRARVRPTCLPDSALPPAGRSGGCWPAGPGTT